MSREKYSTEDWARHALAKRLGLNLTGKRKTQQWYDLVRTFACRMDHYEHLLRECVRGQHP